ncbi:MAG: AI-2E family transporter [Thermoguttaceae bacterium]
MEAGDERREYSRRVLLTLTMTATLVLAVWLLYAAAQAFLLMLVGILGGVFLGQLSIRLARLTGLSYHRAWSVVAASLVLASAAGFLLMGARVAERAGQFAEQLQRTTSELRGRIEQQPWGRQILQKTDGAQDLLASGQAVSTAGTALGVLATAITGAIVAVVLALYLSLQPDHYRHGLIALVVPAKRRRAGEVLDQLGVALWRWLLGRLAGMLIIGVTSAIGLSIIGIPLSVELGVLAGLLNFVPNIGPLTSVVPPLLFALQKGTGTVVSVIVLYLVLQFVETYLLTPLIEQHQISLPPGLTLSAQVLLGLLFGFLGILLATPLTVVASILVKELYVEDILGGYEPEGVP